ncbi:MAG: hypothetical protein AB1585_08245 [Thermodesulfobacteriota bacterium]
MKPKNIGTHNRILIIDNDPRFFTELVEETGKIGLSCSFQEAKTFFQAVESLFSGMFELVLLDFPGIRGPYLLNLALSRKIPVIILASPTMFPLEARHLQERGIKEIFPKENLEDIVSALGVFFQLHQPR